MDLAFMADVTNNGNMSATSQFEVVSRLLGLVECKRVSSNVKTDYRISAILESTIRRLKVDLNRLQNVERRKKSCRSVLRRKIRRMSCSVDQNQNGGSLFSLSLVPTSYGDSPKNCSRVESEDSDPLGLDDFFKRLKNYKSVGCSES